MVGDKLNPRGGSFLPKDDTFLQGITDAREKRRSTASQEDAPVKNPLTGKPFPQTEIPKGPVMDDDDAASDMESSKLSKVRQVPAEGPLGGTADILRAGANGVPDMQGGLPDVFKKEAELLGITITDDDIVTYLTQGTISKVMPLVKGLLSAQIRTITSDEVSDVNMRMSLLLKERPDTIQKEYLNRNTMHMFGYAIEAIGKPGALRPLPKDYDAKIKQLGGLSSQIFAKLAHRYNLLEFLIQDKISDANFLKN